MIEAWRGIACLGVVFFHSFTGSAGHRIPLILEHVRHVANFGWFGVDLFFVISGFCIAEKVHVMAGRGQSSTRFLAGRFLRIFPPYWCAIALTLVVGLAAMPFNRLSAPEVLPFSLRAWLGEISLLQPILQTRATLVVSWSLFYEVGFYLLIAVTLLGGTRNRFLPWFFGAGTLLCLTPLIIPTTLLPALLGLWPDFFLGVAAFTAIRARHRGPAITMLIPLGIIVGLGALAFTGTLMPDAFPAYAGWRRVAAAGFALTLVLLYPFDQRLAHQSIVQLFATVGGYSYSLYLIHVLFLTRILNLGLRTIPYDSLAYFGLWLVAISSAIAGGYIFNRWIEYHLESLRRRLVEREHPTTNQLA
jgi:peptidoglycan/LPS O-acetylase OafA/YrhL